MNTPSDLIRKRGRSGKPDSKPVREAIHRFCHDLADRLRPMHAEEERQAAAARRLPLLLGDHALMKALLNCIREDAGYPNLRRCGIFDNEVLLHTDPNRLFSLRLYFHEPDSLTPIHDHSAWGVSGTPFGDLRVVRYRTTPTERQNGSRTARITETGRQTLKPGEVETTQPLEHGIHQTGGPKEGMNAMISIYGRPARRLYLLFYDTETGRPRRVHPPRIRTRLLAGRACRDIQS